MPDGQKYMKTLNVLTRINKIYVSYFDQHQRKMERCRLPFTYFC